jgi:hypothetical protein
MRAIFLCCLALGFAFTPSAPAASPTSDATAMSSLAKRRRAVDPAGYPALFTLGAPRAILAATSLTSSNPTV